VSILQKPGVQKFGPHPKNQEDGSPGFVQGFLSALQFAALKHSKQRRKGVDANPYVNHPIMVAELLARVAGVSDLGTLQAAILHDTLEDTETTSTELDAKFGAQVCRLVEELTDDKSLPSAERKRLQVEHAKQLSKAAKLIKLADKTANLTDLNASDPVGWSIKRKRDYVEWATSVVAGLRGINVPLEELFDRLAAQKRNLFEGLL
jgi:(p)ppGpp synthase/HD superfamily hydrolase